MQTATWNKRHFDGSVEEIRFTRMFTTEGGEEEQRIKRALEVIAHRQGLIRSEEQFLSIMEQLSLAHQIAVITSRSEEEANQAKEYFGTQAMLATVRYGLHTDHGSTVNFAMNRFKKFMADAALRSSKGLSA